VLTAHGDSTSAMEIRAAALRPIVTTSELFGESLCNSVKPLII
jgi:hypothetical protein